MQGPYYVIPKGGAFSFIEKGIKAVARSVVPGFSAVEGVAKALTHKKRPTPQGPVLQGPTVMTPGGTIATLGSIRLPGGLGLTLPGFGPQDSGTGCPAGYHPAKDGSGRCVRNRRINYANGRAAGRAATRLKGTVKQLSRYANAIGKKVVSRGATQKRGKR